ncbi:L,D-transpeptidase [Polynucleobacter sp. MWH-UH23A]|uniref:L,D-transpeptidase n=1 Tax=Polynucleobacter sp. MWH-UH23A TaxID=1855613 RepID=UPI0033650326
MSDSSAITQQELSKEFSVLVTPYLDTPESVSAEYAAHLERALKGANIWLEHQQFVILVDRNPNIQAAFLYLGSEKEGWSLLGVAPISSGLPGKFEHFLTPIGVFEHSLDNPDFRALGTKNELGFRGYGEKGMRVYDFGWIAAQRTWGKKEIGVLRLQMHATDPELAENLLGTPRSEGCIRIPATLNQYIDHYGVLDAQYDKAASQGSRFWVLAKNRTVTPFSGKYLVVIDTNQNSKPEWSKPLKKKANHQFIR